MTSVPSDRCEIPLGDTRIFSALTNVPPKNPKIILWTSVDLSSSSAATEIVSSSPPGLPPTNSEANCTANFGAGALLDAETLTAAIHLPDGRSAAAGAFPTHVFFTAAIGVPVFVGPLWMVHPTPAVTRPAVVGVAAAAPLVARDGGMRKNLGAATHWLCFAASHKGLRAVRAYSLFTGEYVHLLLLTRVC